MINPKAYNPEVWKRYTPRRWQERFSEEVLKKYQTGARDFLCEAVPAGGKTFGSLRIACKMIDENIIEQVIIVAPTDYLREQWCSKAWNMAGMGLKPFEIDPRTGRIVLNEQDFCGVVTTYAQASSGANADILLGLGRQKKTLVIFDEVHHCGEEKTWGSGIISAFWANGGESLFYRLSISGTPFRSDNESIPFVNYEKKYVTQDDGTIEVQRVSIPDFRYGYVDALMDDEVVREVTFRMETGKFSWKSNIGDYTGKEFVDVDFTDEIDEALRNERYKTAVNPQNDATGQPSKFVVELLTKADEELSLYRNRHLHLHAGGLVLAEDKESAEIIGEILKNITGEDPVVVHNSVADARSLIEQFEKNSKRWIVSVRMVSEGVDIPRLRVAVFLSRFKTQLFFLQFVGRVTRWISTLPITDADGLPLGQPATIFLPSDPELIEYARKLQDEIDHYIRLKMERLGGGGGPGGLRTSEYEWINATEAQDQAEGHHAAGGYAEASPEEFTEIDEFKNRFQILRHAPRGSVKGIMEYARQGQGMSSASESDQRSDILHYEAVKAMVDRDRRNKQDGWESIQSKHPAKQNADMRTVVKKMVNRLAYKLIRAQLLSGNLFTSNFKQKLTANGINFSIGSDGQAPSKLIGEMSKAINAAFIKIQKVDAKSASNEQVQERIRLLADWEDEILLGKCPYIPGITW